jgi:hypothetical protein
VPDLDRYLELTVHRVDAAWLGELARAGMRAEGLAQLVEIRLGVAGTGKGGTEAIKAP